MSGFLAGSLILSWTIVMAVNVLGNAKVAIIALVFGTIGYPFSISALMTLLKYQSL